MVISHNLFDFRWEVSALNQLPDYMKHVYQKLLDTYNMFDDEMAKQGRSYRVEYAKLAVRLEQTYFFVKFIMSNNTKILSNTNSLSSKL